jgi:hypothetical protein
MMDRVGADAEELLGELREGDFLPEAAGFPAVGPWDPKRALKKVRYTHEAMIDIILANPGVHQNQLANHFGYSPAWISTVMQTDAFRTKMEERGAEVIDPVLRATIRERFMALTARSLEVLQEKLSKPDVSMIPDNLALRAAELGAKALGYGGNVIINPPAPPGNHLEDLAKRLVALQSTVRTRTGDVEDARIVET